MRTLLLAALTALAVTQTPPPSTQFVGTMPCGEAVRAFVGGMAPGAPCHAITFELTFRDVASGPTRWTLNAAYGVPPASNPNLMVEGPKVSIEGVLERTHGAAYDRSATVYRLVSGNPQRTFSFVEIDGAVLHALTGAGDLMTGTPGWSYTLYRADRIESPAMEGPSNGMSYTNLPRATGPGVLGVFEGRSPCTRIAHELRQADIPGCARVKWRVTLFWDPDSKQPTTYRIEGSIYRGDRREGRWRNGRGIGLNPDAAVYQLEGTPAEGPILLLRGSNDVLFFLDGGRSPLVGTKDLSYTLNRVSF